MKLRLALLFVLTLGTTPVTGNESWNTVWDAASGDLPNEVVGAYTVLDTAPTDPALAGGVLTLGTPSRTNVMLYEQIGPIFTPLPPTLVIEARMRVVSDVTINSARRAAAISFSRDGRRNALNIGPGEVFLLASGGQSRASTASVDTSAMHTYRIEMDAAGAITVFQDGNQVLTGTGWSFSEPPRIQWGDLTTSAFGTSEWEFVRHNAPTLPSPKAQTTRWEASSGDLPEEIARSYGLLDTAAADPSLGGNVLTLSTATNAELMVYRQSGAILTPLPEVLAIEGRGRYVSGTSTNAARTHMAIGFSTGSLRSALYIGQDEIFLVASGGQSKGRSASVDTDDAMHTYRLVVGPSGAINVYYDGLQVLTGAAWAYSEAPRIGFGDSTTSAAGVSEWEYFWHNAPAASSLSTVVAEPTEISAFCGTSTITVTPRDAGGTPIGPGAAVVVNTTAGELLGTVTDEGDGTYTQVLRATSGMAAATIAATVNGVPLNATATVTVTNTPPRFRLTGLGSFQDGTRTFLTNRGTGVTDNGWVCGTGLDGSTERAFRWRDGVIEALAELPGGGNESEGGDINSLGHVAGLSRDSSGQRAVIWRTDPAAPVVLSSATSFVTAINDAGQMTGSRQFFGPIRIDPSGSGYVEVRLTPAASRAGGQAVAINDRGYAAGLSSTSGSSLRATLWTPGGTVVDLARLPGGSSTLGAYANGINSSNHVVGISSAAGVSERAVAWPEGTAASITDLGFLPDGTGRSRAWGINDCGNIVGDSVNAAGQTRAVIWVNGIADLNDYIDGAPGWTVETARAVNNLGWIVGRATNPAGQKEAFLLKPGVAAEDTNQPDVRITAPEPDDVVATTTVTVEATVEDASATTVTSVPAGLAASLPAGGGTAAGTVALPNDGEHSITVTATDAAGLIGGDSITVIRDTIAPGIEVLSPADGAVVGTSPVTVTVQVTDLTATSVDVAGQPFNLPAGGGTVVASVALSEGLNEIAITATDAAGHTTPATLDVTLDTTAPMVTIDSPANGACFGPGDSPVAVSATVDDLTATSVSSTPSGVSDNLPAGGGIAMGAVALQEGYNTITVTATDAAGTPGSDSVVVLLDTTAPDVSFTSPGNGDAVRGTIDLAVDATDPLPGSGIDRVEVFVDGNLHTTLNTAPFEMMLDTTAFGDGAHTLRAVAYDGKGIDNDTTISITVDNTVPTVTILAPADGAVVGGTVPFEVLVEDATSGVASATMRTAGVAPTGDASTTYATPVASDTLNGSEDTTRWPDGPLTLTAVATDAAGNQSAVATANVTLDNTKPDKTIVTPSAGDVVSGTITITATANDPNLATIEVFVDGNLVGTGTSSPFAVPFDTTTRLDGSMTIRVVATDTVGNFDPCEVEVTVDNISFELKPSLLNLKAKGGGAPITATLTGPNLAPLLPTENHTIELRVPGGNPVPAEQGWDGDDALQGNDDKLKLRFSRTALAASVQAGLAGGAIPANATAVDITLIIDGFEIGTTSLGLKR